MSHLLKQRESGHGGIFEKVPNSAPTLTWVAISKGKNPDRDEVQRAEETSNPGTQVLRSQSCPWSIRPQESQN